MADIFIKLFKLKNLHESVSFLLKTKITKKGKKGDREDAVWIFVDTLTAYWMGVSPLPYNCDYAPKLKIKYMKYPTLT